MTMKVSAELFGLAYEAVSKEETRYYMNGVRVEPHHEKGALLISTDGHRMIVIHDDKAEVDESAIVQLPKFALQQLKPHRGFSLERKVIDVSVADKTATISIEHSGKDGAITKTDHIMTAHNVIIDGLFPNWRGVLPTGEMEPTGVVGVNGKSIASIGLLGSKIPTVSNTAMYVMKKKGQDDNGPTVIRWSGVHHIVALLMPMRADIELSSPGFLDLPKG